jgi:hypothetical protein
MRTATHFAKSGAIALAGFTGRPARNHSGSVNIRVVSVRARCAAECRLVGPVLLGDVSTLTAFPRGIAGIDKKQRDSGYCRFVGDKQPQLRKRPTVENCSMFAPNSNPVADATQVFEFKSAIRAFSASNDLLANHVVHVAGESLFLARQLFQTALRRSGLFLLEFGTQTSMPMANRFDFAAAVSFAVRGRGDIRNSKINTQKLRRVNRRIVRKFDSTKQVELSLTVNEVSLPSDAIKTPALVFTVYQRNDHPLLWKSPQAHFVDALKAHNALVVGNRAARLKCRADLLISGKTLNSFTDSPNRHLRRQSKSRPYLDVSQFVDRRLAKNASIKTAASRERCGFVITLHRRQQALGLLGVGKQLQLQCQLHYLGVYYSLSGIATARRPALPTPNLFLCPLKQAVSKVQNR